MARNIRVGITHGDINGIGYEVIIKALDDERIPELFTPVIFGSDKVMNYYRTALEREEFRVRRIRQAGDADENSVNLVDVCDKDIKVEPGEATEAGGRAALVALEAACEALDNGDIDVLVTAPINKAAIHGDDFPFPGHTEYLESKFSDDEHSDKALMILFSEGVRIALVTIHIPVGEVASRISGESVEQTVRRLDRSLRRDFRIERPRIAVLALNPHCGDAGVIGSEDDTIIRPTIEKLRLDGIMAFGPYASDGFFGSGSFSRFDGVVAMYHDQGLAPFKTLAGARGVNFTAGLKYVRTSPDHGTGYDIAAKDYADPESMRNAIYSAIDIYRARRDFDYALRNPLRPLPTDRKKNSDKADKNTDKSESPKASRPDKENTHPQDQPDSTCTTE